MKIANKRLIIGLGIIGLIIIIRFSGIGKYITLETIRAQSTYLQYYVTEYYLFSMFFFISLCACIVTLSIPVSPVLTVAGGYFFSIIPGAIYSIMGATLGAIISFLLFRYLLRGFVQEKYGMQLRHFNEEFKKRGANYLLFLQLMPITPFGVICIIAGLSSISLWTFIWTTVIGIVPGSFIYAFAGRQLMSIARIRDIFSWPIVLALTLLAFLSLIPVILRYFKQIGSKES